MRVQRKRYLRMDIELVSSLSIGSGENENTDHDILVNPNGIPYIPGSAVAGVTRHALSESGLLLEDTDKAIFGHVVINNGTAGSKDTEEQTESCIVTYDVPLRASDGQFHVTSRDMVALDSFKTAIEGAKFDMEALEPGTTGTVIIEENQIEESDIDPLLLTAQIWNSEGIRFGAKTTRGYGAIKVVGCYRAEFDMTTPAGVMGWLAFSPLNENADCWEAWDNIGRATTNEIQLELQLEQVGGISIRKYTTDVPPKGTAPDYAQMTYYNGDPVIPGTSWAGAFRHAIEGFVGGDTVKAYFGNVTPSGKRRSAIYFSESRITGGENKQFTRSAINRFTGGSADKSLYTERTYYGGTTALTIAIRRSAQGDERRFLNALAAAVVDLHEGILAVGGETSIGRGLFKVTGVNGQPIAGDAAGLYVQVRQALGEGAQA